MAQADNNGTDNNNING